MLDVPPTGPPKKRFLNVHAYSAIKTHLGTNQNRRVGSRCSKIHNRRVEDTIRGGLWTTLGIGTI